MRLRRLMFAGVAVLASGVACGGTVQDGNAVTGGGSGSAGVGGQGGTSAGGGAGFGTGGVFGMRDAGLTDARYVDPGCPPATKIAGTRACDPFDKTNGECGPGNRCVPYVRYGKDCKTEEIGTQCESAGTAVQGEDCSTADCAAGFVCATSGTGFRCAQLCQLEGNRDTCTSGLICSPLDVDGFFVCG